MTEGDEVILNAEREEILTYSSISREKCLSGEK